MALLDGGELVARSIKAEGVNVIFTLCGGHVQAVYNACLNNDIRVVDVRHEQAAGHAAEGWSRATRRCGVAVVTAGPGVTDVVTAVANAHQNRSPLLVIGGRSPLSRFGMGALQEIDQIELMRPITKWASCVYETRRIPEIIGTAFRQALSNPAGPTFVEIPSDVLFRKVDEREVFFPDPQQTQHRPSPDPEAIRQAAAILATAARPVVVAGSLTYWHRAETELRQLAEALQMPVYLNGMGRGSIPQDHPLFFSRSRRNALAGADVILVSGAPLDFRMGYGKRFNAEAKTIQIDSDPTELGRNRNIDIRIEADIRAALRSLRSELADPRTDHTAWLKSLRDEEEKIFSQREEFISSNAVPIHPLRLCHELASFVNDETIVVGDGGDIVGLASQMLPINQPGQWYDPGPLGTLGVGTGFCLALAYTHPNKRILMVNGDGTFGLNGFEFDTFVRFDIPVVSVIGNDRQWGQITVGQRAMYGEDRVTASLLNDSARYDQVVTALGGHGELVTEPSQIAPALERAFASGKPACVNVITDPKPPGVRGGYDFM